MPSGSIPTARWLLKRIGPYFVANRQCAKVNPKKPKKNDKDYDGGDYANFATFFSRNPNLSR
jgi:hypothetical protein